MLNFTRRLPLLIALGAFAFYDIAVSHGVTTNSLALTSKVAGWNWTPMVGQPLLWLLTLPLRLLPAGWVALVLNLFSAGLAAVMLGLLARSIQLLPWDRPLENENRWLTMLPILLACSLCGLEFSFWQDATAATGEMLDLLLLATTLWLLLEYRVRRESFWRNAAVFVWGLGMAENWVMLLALPLLVAGLIWLQGRHFFRVKLILRLAVLGLAGFSIYILLPLVNGLAPHSPWNLSQAWLASLKQTKSMGLLLYHQFWMAHRLLSLAAALYFLVPTLSLLVRLRDEGTRNKSGVDRFQIWLYRSLRAVLLLACVWLAFDPAMGLRQIIQHQFGLSLPLLTFDYLNALGAAFLAGNLLLISHKNTSLRRRSRAGFQWRQLAFPAAAASFSLITVGLAVRNAPAIFSENFHPLQRFGELAVASLPAGGGVMLSDQPQKLAVFQAALSHDRRRRDWLAVDAHALPMVEYRAWLERHRPAGWLTDETRHQLTPAETVRLLGQVARTNRLFYLHPSHGIFFEQFYLEPKDSIYEMKLRAGTFPGTAPLSVAATEVNETFWTGLWQKELAPLASAPSRRQTGWPEKIQRLGFTSAPRFQNRLLAEWYSLSLDGWGVTLQQQGRLPEARARFEQALQLNTNNFSARINLAGNASLHTGRKQGLAEAGQMADPPESLQHLILGMNHDGPFDDPVYCFRLGSLFQQSGLPLQAVEQLERTRTLAPDALPPELALAELYSRLQLPDRARQLVETQLARTPDDVNVLNLQAAMLIQSGQVAAAIPIFDHMLTLTNLMAARLNRANAQVICQNFAAAETDYRELEKSGAEPGRVSYGLAAIAGHRHDTNEAVRRLRFCLTNTPSGTLLWRQASTRLQALESSPKSK
jgi:tetratricopeptide (TPR) repeat protein